MSRPPSSQPTDGELAILKLLWEAGPAELRQICAGLNQDRKVATTTVATMLNVMLNKGLVERREGDRGYVWSAKLTRNAATTGLLGKLLDGLFEGSAQRLVAHLLEQGQLTADERREIQQLLSSSSSIPSKRRGGRP